tara:strand:- start:2993 stop:5098 length:2106 start_codon:yes stop_codon:yes gene_type:complete
MVVLSGSEEWCFSTAKKVSNAGYLAVSQNKQYDFMNLQAAEKLHLILGREYENILWDGFSSLNPDGLGIASGLLKGGGLFLLLLPPLDYLKSHADHDYARMCSEGFSIKDCHTFFLQRLVNHLQDSGDIVMFEEGKAVCLTNCDVQQSHKLESALKRRLPTIDQTAAIAAIKKVAFGHRNRPLVIQAHRGRGKSSALGLAAGEIFLEKKFKTVITAPSKKTCEAAFRHYKTLIKSTVSTQLEIDTALAAFAFVPLDILLANTIDCHMLFIDEAAAIPTSSLTALLGRFSRVVYSTTIHGYEGNGQGFAIRFQKTLDTHYATWKSITLNTPVRWLEHDLLEPWFFRFLFLDAKLTETREYSIDALKTTLVSQRELFEDEALFEQITALLVSAHYQTSPSDIRLILDHPKVSILITRQTSSHSITPADLCGVCLVIEEGSSHSEALAEDIISGRRRPRGQLFPQALCASSANAEFLAQGTYRIMRIAVHPSVQQKGIGSELLNALKLKAEERHIDSLSTSYGLNPELLSFWTKNQFQMVKLGSKVDGASGLRSTMMMHAISEPAHQLLENCSEAFLKSFIFNLTRLHQTLPSTIVYKVLQSLPQLKPALNKQTDIKKIWAFANASRAFEETNIELFELVLGSISSPMWDNLSEDKKELLITQVLQNRDYKTCLKHLKLTGKKQLLTALRQAVAELLRTKAIKY